MTEANQAFKVPPELEAQIRAKAAALVSAEAVDESALLAQYVAEARAARDAALRAQAAELVDPAKPSLDSHGFPEKYSEIVIYKGQGRKELSYVPIGVNGFFWKLERGAKHIVPNVVVEALEHAVTEEVTQFEGGLETQPVHRFPFQTIRSEVPKAEFIAARAARSAKAAQASAA